MCSLCSAGGKLGSAIQNGFMQIKTGLNIGLESAKKDLPDENEINKDKALLDKLNRKVKQEL